MYYELTCNFKELELVSNDYKFEFGFELANQYKIRKNKSSTILGTSKDPNSSPMAHQTCKLELNLCVGSPSLQ